MKVVLAHPVPAEQERLPPCCPVAAAANLAEGLLCSRAKGTGWRLGWRCPEQKVSWDGKQPYCSCKSVTVSPRNPQVYLKKKKNKSGRSMRCHREEDDGHHPK